MKVHFGIILVGALILVSGCARKCPPCPTAAPVSYGTGVYSPATTSFASPSSNYSSTASTTTSQYDDSAAYRYAKK